MNKIMINKDLIKQISSFLKKANSLKYLDPNIFETIDEYKEINDIPFNDYYLEYIKDLPRLDFENVVKISRRVYQLYGKEKEFDTVLEALISNYSIDTGSLNKDDENCITNATESRVLLSGTYYDVILLCHEIGHKLRNNNFMNSSDLMDSFFFETPSIILEFAANNYLKDNYDIDIEADKLRKMHVLSIKRENNIEKNIFFIIIKLLKERKLNVINLYKEFVKNSDVIEYLNRPGSSINECVEEVMSSYSYDIGYIIGNYTNNSDNKIEILNTLLKYKDNGINIPFTIKEDIIKEALGHPKFTK